MSVPLIVKIRHPCFQQNPVPATKTKGSLMDSQDFYAQKSYPAKMKPWILVIPGLLMLLFIDQYQVKHWQTEKKAELGATLKSYKIRLESCLAMRFDALEALSSLFILHPHTTAEEFALFASQLIKFHPPIRAIQYANSDTQVTYVYPQKGNKITIDEPMVLLKDPKRGPFTLRAIQHKKAVMQGPFELRQKGKGMVLRFPIFKDDTFIGLSIGVYDLDVLIEGALKILDLEKADFSLLDQDGKTIWRSGKLAPGYLEEPITVADTFWRVRGNISDKLAPPLLPRLLIWGFGTGFVVATIFFINNLQKNKKQLEQLVAERTNELYQAKEKYRLAMDATLDGIWDWNIKNGQVTYSQNWLKILEEEEVAPEYQSWESKIHPEDKPQVLSSLQDHLAGKTPQWKMEHRLKTKTGEYKWVLGRGRVVDTSSDGEALRMVGTMTDISERKKLDDRFKQIQKMESIGNLAGGIAHDFNNLLCPIVGMSEMLLEDLPVDSPEHRDVQEIFSAGKRGADLVKQILAFSRQSEHKVIPVSIQAILKEVLKLSRATIPSNIQIVDEIERDCGMVMADPTKIHQVGMNIITNAFHAVEVEGGTITVQLKEILVKKETDLPSLVLKQGRYAQLSVSDTGHGMSRETMDKIFDPYFTTKKQGKGTGLGLSVAYGIIKEHNGDISVESELGKGTIFHIWLPVMEENIVPKNNGGKKMFPTGNESILLVDDEESIARLEAQVLTRLGYNVTFYVSSREALEAFEEHSTGFDLVITDMTMPDMTGDQLSRAILSIRPDMPVIICTGYSERLNEERAEQIGVKGFLMKPVTKSDMAVMVRNVLDDAKRPKTV